MVQNLPVIQYMFRKEPALFLDVLQEISSDLYKVESSSKALEVLLGTQGGVVFFALYEKRDLTEIGSALNALKSVPIKAVVVNFTKNEKLEEKVLKLGVQDFISQELPKRVLKFKLNFWLRTLKSVSKKTSWEVIEGENQNVFIQKDEVFECRFDDYFEGDLILEAPQNKIQKGVVGEYFGEIKKGLRIQLKGSVTSSQDDFITIRLTHSSQNLIEKTMDEFQIHQDEVDNLMKKMKGH